MTTAFDPERAGVEAMVQASATEWWAFAAPNRVLRADTLSQVGPLLTEVDRLTRVDRLHAVGYLTYEAGAAFGLPVSPGVPTPLGWFALFEPKNVSRTALSRQTGDYRLGALEPSLDRRGFDAAFAAVRRHLAEGDTYQANFTFKMTGIFEGDDRALFADLVRAQGCAHGVYLRHGGMSICSASPELFFERRGRLVIARPMKGTAKRGRTAAEDERQRAGLRESAKQRAENVMIVDMMRNDLGRVADVGSVTVPALFEAERYPNVWQMTSQVSAHSEAPLDRLFGALHPSASVTGAPKRRTMEILAALESSPRGVYTGAVGHVEPGGDARFNVAIRTAVLDRRAGTIEFGIGSGIVWDSDAADEYEECLLKGTVLGRRYEPFELLETLRWTPDGGWFLLERHLARMRESAGYFGYAFDRDAVERALQAAGATLRQPSRVRLLVDENGSARVETHALVTGRTPIEIALASSPVDDDDVFLYHKTTHRAVYERARAKAADGGDVILWNGRREVTEATVANVVAEIDGERVTPPIASGLLAGTFRAELLARGEIRERIVTVDELRRAARIWLINSVHEWREAVWRRP